MLVDCDVEEPNDILFFPDASIVHQSNVTKEIPFIDTSKCIYCRKCVAYCELNAIVVIPPVKFAEINASLCHSCGADYIILVTEPTPFGLHDLKLMVQLLREIEKPFGVVINKANLGNQEIYDYLESEGIELLTEIPEDINRAYKKLLQTLSLKKLIS